MTSALKIPVSIFWMEGCIWEPRWVCGAAVSSWSEGCDLHRNSLSSLSKVTWGGATQDCYCHPTTQSVCNIWHSGPVLCSIQTWTGGRECCVWHGVKNTYLSSCRVFKCNFIRLLTLIFHNSIVHNSSQVAPHQCFQLQVKHWYCTFMCWTRQSLVNCIKKTFYSMLNY